MSETTKSEKRYDVVVSTEFGDDPQIEAAKIQTQRLLEQWRGRLVPDDNSDGEVTPRTYPSRGDGDPQVTLHSASRLHVQAEINDADGMTRYSFDGANVTAVGFTPGGTPLGELPDSQLALHNSLSWTLFSCDMRENRGDPGVPVSDPAQV